MHTIGGETLTNIGKLPITNTLTTVVVVDLLLILVTIIVRFKLSFKPNTLQAILEAFTDFIKNLVNSVLNEKYSNIFIPYLCGVFIFILINNWIGLLPGMETIYIKVGHGDEIEKIALFKGATADLNLTIVLAIMSFLIVHISGIYFMGIKGWISHFLHTKPLYLLPIFIFIAILELLLDPIKYLSLSLRLFGNILAGETLVSSMLSIPGAAVPFMLLEVLVGILQALIFTGLSLAFISTMLKEEHH